jgi:hypothetical protein
MSASGRDPWGSPTRATEWLVLAAVAATLALLLIHARLYSFLCDDAYISFRYARNLAAGHGLVFNPGFERVEGYTNFLWVLILAGVARLGGTPPEAAANPLLLASTVGLWALVAGYAWGSRRLDEPAWPAVVPPLLLAATRSVAVWSTGGLETRLFELLVVGATLRLLSEVSSAERTHRRLPLAAVLYALAAWTRPDGLLLASTALGVAALCLAARRALTPGWVAAQLAGFVPLVLGHLLWRHAYYDTWLPNTYYAKVGGATWWSMGGAYLASAALEYSAWLWVPFLVLGVQRHARLRSLHVPLVFAAIVLPHALYVASVGGDHFEYRPLDLYFPFAFLLVGDGVFELARSRRGSWLAAASLPVLLAGLVAIPWRSHIEAPDHYEIGFPGLAVGNNPLRSSFLDPARNPIYRWPVLRALAELQRSLLRRTTFHFVGIRQEEHRHFLATVALEGRRLGEFRERGLLPEDAFFAISCVGAIPYYSGLRTLDRFGLTDAVVARSPSTGHRFMAHDKHATLEYATQAGVDFWALDDVHSLWALSDEMLPRYLAMARRGGGEIWIADVGDDEILLGALPQGLEATARRFPKLRYENVKDDAVYAGLLARISAARQDGPARGPGTGKTE